MGLWDNFGDKENEKKGLWDNFGTGERTYHYKPKVKDTNYGIGTPYANTSYKDAYTPKVSLDMPKAETSSFNMLSQPSKPTIPKFRRIDFTLTPEQQQKADEEVERINYERAFKKGTLLDKQQSVTKEDYIQALKDVATGRSFKRGLENLGNGIKDVGYAGKAGLQQVGNTLNNINLKFARDMQDQDQMLDNVVNDVQGWDRTNVNSKLVDNLNKSSLENQAKIQDTQAKIKNPNILTNAIQSIPNTVLVGGAGGLGAIGLGANANAQQEAVNFNPNISSSKRNLYGGLVGGTETATEFLPFSKLKKIGAGKGALKDLAVEMVGEYFGEGTSEVLSPFMEKVYNEDALDGWTWQQSLSDFNNAGLTGAVSAILLGGASMGSQKAIKSIKNKDYSPETIEQIKQEIEQVAKVELPTQSIKQVAEPNKTLPTPQELEQIVDTNKMVEPQNTEVDKKAENSPQIKPLTENSQQIIPKQPQNADMTPLMNDKGEMGTNEQTNVRKRLEELDNVSDMTAEQAESALAEINDMKEKGLLFDYNLQLFAEKVEQKIMKIRKTAQSIQNADFIPENLKAETKRKELQGDFDYEEIHNKDTLEEAQRQIDENYQGELEKFLSTTSLESATDTAKGQELLRRASIANDIDTYNKVSEKYARLATNAGQTVQAMSMLQRMTPEGMLQHGYHMINEGRKNNTAEKVDDVAKQIDDILNSDTTNKAKDINKMLNENTNISQKITLGKMGKKKFVDNLIRNKFTNEEVINHLKAVYKIEAFTNEEAAQIKKHMENAQKLEGREKDVEIAKALGIIADKVPKTKTEQFAALQRISMLLNPRTQVRNVGGNIGMTALEMVKEIPRIPIDALTSKVLGADRTATNYKMTDLSKGIKGAKKGLYEAYDDYIKGVNTRKDRGQFEVTNGKIFNENTKFKSVNVIAKGLNKANNLTSFLLSGGDRPFFEAHYEMEKSRLSRLDKYKDESKLEDVAIEIAEERTFQNRSWIANAATEARGKFGIAGRVVLPYSYTPTNIADKIFDYTPIGVTRTIGKNMLYDNFSKDGKFDQKQFTERAARNLTGTALIALGYELAKKGLLTGAYDEDDDVREFQKSVGMLDYAFNVDGKQYTYDWAQPVAVPFAIGANLFNADLSEYEMKETVWNKLIQANVESSNILLEQPLLTGLQKLFGGYGTDSMASNIMGLAKDTPTQIIPLLSLARQARKIQDPYQRQIDYNDTLQGLKNSLPKTSEDLPKKYNTLGEEVTYGKTLGERALSALLSPGQSSTVELSPVEQLFMDTYETTGDKTIFPRKPNKSYYKLTQNEISE